MSSPANPPPVEESSSKKGCLIGCLVVLVLMIASCGGCVFYGVNNIGSLGASYFGMLQPEIGKLVDEDVPEDLAATFEEEFGHFLDELRSIDDLEGDDAENRQQKILAFAGRLGEYMQDQRFSQSEVEDFIDGVRALRGLEPEEEPEEEPTDSAMSETSQTAESSD